MHNPIILFIIIVLLIAFYISKYFSETYNNQIALSECLKMFILSFIIGGILIGRHVKILLIAFAISILLLLSVIISPSISDKSFSEPSYYLIMSFIGILSFIIASVGNILAGQFILLRKRQYSFEPQFFMWLNVFEECKFIPDYQIDDGNQLEKAVIDGLFKKIIDFTFFGKGES